MVLSYYELRGKKSKKISIFDTVVNKVINAFVDTETEKLDIKLKYVDILRGEEVVNDLKDTFIDKYPIVAKFEVADLFYLLYGDFIMQIKNGKFSHSDAADFLIDGKRKYLDILSKRRSTRKEIQQVSPNSFIFEDIEEEDEDFVENGSREFSINDVVYFELIFNIRQNNRCKVFLYDIEPYLDGEVINVEDVIAIRYLNFIDQVRLEGNNPKIMKSILKNFIAQNT